jgi:Uma2 family endonuclease
MAVTRVSFMTEQDLLRFAEQNEFLRFEIVDGEMVEMTPIGVLHNIVAGNAYSVLRPFVHNNKLGYVFTDNLIYVLHHDPETGVRNMRVPDGSFVRKGRLPKDFDLSLPFPGAPYLAIEVMSPSDTADELMSRIRDYFQYGTEQVWVMYPKQRELHQHVRGETVIRVYGAEDILTAESLLPGFALVVGELFVVPDIDE